MLRRLIASSCRRTLPTSTARAAVGPILCIGVASHRSITTHATRAAPDTARERNASGSNNSSSSQRRSPLPPLSPAFDIVHWNDADVAAGHLVRVIYRDSHIVLEYHRQTRRIMDDDGRRIDGDGRGNAERLVTLTLPPVYIARFLGVLEGRMSEVEVQSRFTNATFKPDTSTAKAHHYILRCVSHRPTTGQRQTAEGVDIAEDSVEWQVSLDAAESLMLHRFLTQALKYNSGFGRQRTDMSGITNEDLIHRNTVNESQNVPHLEGYHGDVPTEMHPDGQFHYRDSATHEHAEGGAAEFTTDKEMNDEENDEVGSHAEDANWSIQEQPIEVDLNADAGEEPGAGNVPDDPLEGGADVNEEAGGAHPKASEDPARPNEEVSRHESHDRRSHGPYRWRGPRPSGEPARDGSNPYPSQPRRRESWPNHHSASPESASPFASMYRSRVSTYTHGRTVSAQFDWNAQHLRYASAVAAPRYHSARRAGSVNRFTGLPDNFSRHLPLSESEIDAIDRMAMHDARRQQAYERAQDIELMRESYVVTVELQKEKAAYERWLELHDRQNRLRRKRQIQEAEHLKMIEKRRAELARQKERLLQERLQRIESAARYSYRGSSNRLPSTFLSQNTSMHEDMSNRRFSMERQTTNLNSRKQYDGNRWEDPNEGSADRGLNTNGGSHAAASRTSRLGGSAARRSVPPGESNTDLERTRVSTIVSHTRAWR